MRRKVIAITALVCLVAAGAAYAATTFNTYKASYGFKGKAGSKKKPAPIGATLTYNATNATSGDRAWPLIDIKSSWAGVKSNWKYFPTCTAKQMLKTSKYNAVCPKHSLIAKGTVKSVVGTGTDISNTAPGSFNCALVLWVYNSGHGKLTYFFTVPNPAKCGNFPTGTAQPYVATTKEKHGSLYQDVPLPPDVSTNVASAGLYGSLKHEHLVFKKTFVKHHGKKVPFLASTGCKKHKHKWWVKFTATNGSTKQTKTFKGAAKC